MSRVVIVGAGPAGATLALLLAERGIDVTLLERRRDFAREFRGEILMPSGIEALDQMGLAGLLTRIPTRTNRELTVYLNGRSIVGGSLSREVFGDRLPTVVSQPAFLEGVVEIAGRNPGFEFRPGVAVKSLVREANRVARVVIHDATDNASGERTVRADLVVGADGRNSFVRKQLALSARSMSPPMDVVWCKLPRPDGWTGMHAYIGSGHLLIAYHTWDDTLQLAWVILKGTFGALRSQGIEAWVEDMANHVSPDLAAHLRQSSHRIGRPFLLDSVSDRVDRWSQPGALLIGDAAHAMSPVGGQGINIALRDAIVAANHLIPALSGPVDHERVTRALSDVEAERLSEVQPIQRLQALPPRIVLNRAWYGELARGILGHAVRRPAVRAGAARRASEFFRGVTEVVLTV